MLPTMQLDLAVCRMGIPPALEDIIRGSALAMLRRTFSWGPIGYIEDHEDEMALVMRCHDSSSAAWYYCWKYALEAIIN